MNPDPLVTFKEWYEEAQKGALFHPDSVALATADAGGRPSVRMIYFRGIREGGFSFFTNFDSRKGRELAENPFGAVVFYWPHLGKQVRVEGRVERLSRQESESYFGSRPLQSQITATFSKQSQPMPDETEFMKSIAEAEKAGSAVGCPENWGGFKIMPDRFEFWIRSEDRRHQRIEYRKDGGVWHQTRLYP